MLWQHSALRRCRHRSGGRQKLVLRRALEFDRGGDRIRDTRDGALDARKHRALLPTFSGVGAARGQSAQTQGCEGNVVLYNEKHPDVLTFFAENCLTLRETIIENWHSILTHYVNRHVANVAHSHYEKASCMAGAVRRLRADLDDHLFKRKPVLAERLGLLEQMHSKSFEETNKRVAEFLLKPFREMITQLSDDGRCSGIYADQLWPRCNHLQEGQEGLEKALLLTEAFHEQLLAPAAPTNLLLWLNSTKTTISKVHVFELARRGLAEIRGEKKGGKSQRIFDHVVANPGGFANAQTGVHCDTRPVGFVGDLPTGVVGVVAAAATLVADGAAADAAAGAEEAASNMSDWLGHHNSAFESASNRMNRKVLR